MALLKPLTRDEIAPELHALWDECEKTYPDFRNSWATMAHSPILFRHVWGQLLALKKESPVEARHFEIAILVVSNATRCDYCVAHHSPRALGAGLTPLSSRRSRRWPALRSRTTTASRATPASTPTTAW